MLDIDNPSLQQITEISGGMLKGNDNTFSGVSIDSRTTLEGELFVAIVGPNFDGHDFVQNAVDRGATAIVVENFVEVSVPQIKVRNCLAFLSDLAAIWRNQVNIPIIGITGSNGKTTVKEMTAAILSTKNQGLKTAGNFNNEIGVPLTLLKLRSSHKWAVIEMGASHSGEIDILAKIVRPTISLVNNVALAHIAGFDSIDDIAKTKGDIFRSLDADGTAVMPHNSKYLDNWVYQANTNNILTFGNTDQADVWFEALSADLMSLHLNNEQTLVSLQLIGIHNQLNAVAAATLASVIGFELPQIKQGLESIVPVTGRLEVKQHSSGGKVIDDTYNANPSSAKVAIDYLAALDCKTIFVLGDMGELGDASFSEHSKVGKYAKEAKISNLCTIGDASLHASETFKGKHFTSQESLVSWLSSVLDENTVVLIKGSRFMKMNEIVDMLVES